MKHGKILFFLLFLVSFIILKQFALLHYSVTNSQVIGENHTSSVFSSNSETSEPQVTHSKTSITQRYSKQIHESELCLQGQGKGVSEVPLYWTNRCPERPVVTASYLGRLGNQLWAFASVWSLAKILDREPFLPSCFIESLEKVFQNVTAITPLKYIEHCQLKFDFIGDVISLRFVKNSVVLPMYAQLPEYVIPQLKEFLQLFQFHDHLTNKSQDLLRSAAKGVKDIVYVSVHVRRTDYNVHMKVIYGLDLVNVDFFIRQMNYFRKKYSGVLFVILSDDPDWCDRELSANDTVVVRGNSPEQDLSLLASCNHSILDYGTYGLWGAMMAGGETLLYKLPAGTEMKVAKLMPNWHVVT